MPTQVQTTHRNASSVGPDRAAFRIKDNKYRLGLRVVYVRFVGMYAQYDRIKGDLTCRGYSQSAPSGTTTRH